MLNRTLGSTAAAALLVLNACGAEGTARADLMEVGAQGSEQEQALEFLPVPGDLGLLDEIAAKAVGQVELNVLATKRTNSPLVREYAQFMEGYSNDLVAQVDRLATDKGAAVRAEMTLRDRFHYGRLEYRYGTAFDDKFMFYQSEDAVRSISQIREGREASIDPDVRTLAQDLLEDLQDVGLLLQSVDRYRGSANDQPGTFATLLAQTKLGSRREPGDKGGKAPGKDTGSIPAQDSGQAPSQSPSVPGPVPAPAPGSAGKSP